MLFRSLEGPQIVGIIGALKGMNTTTNNNPEPINGNNNLEETLQKFAQVDPNYQETLKKMADYLQKNPGVLPNIKSIIGA